MSGSPTLTDHLANHFLELPKLPDYAATGTGHRANEHLDDVTALVVLYA